MHVFLPRPGDAELMLLLAELLAAGGTAFWAQSATAAIRGTGPWSARPGWRRGRRYDVCPMKQATIPRRFAK